MYSDGYKYWLAYKKHNISYFRCSRYKQKCPGRCVLEDGTGGNIRNTTAHNHAPEPDRVLVEKFRKALTHRAANETTDLHTIFWDEASQRHADAAMLYRFSAAESAMRKARRKQLPPVPATVLEIGDILMTSALFHVHSGAHKDQFYQSSLVLNDATCLIFAHLKTLQQIERVDEVHLDATVVVQPDMPPNYHLLTMHAVHAYVSIPIVYAVMTAKSPTIYGAVFAYIREHFGVYVSPTVAMTNYDKEMQSAIGFTFPEATVKGYWFHYTDAILQYVKHLALQRETARGHGSSCLRMLMVLPLLPADYMAPGLEAVRKWAQEKKILSTPMATLCTYIEQNWLRAMGADKMSVFGLSHSIFNPIQSFNKDLNTALGNASPSVWLLLESLTYIATRAFVKVKKRKKLLTSTVIDSPIAPPPQPKACHKMRGAIITDATAQWIRTPVHLRNPLHFLQLCSHCINDTIYYSSLDDMKALSRNEANPLSSSQPDAFAEQQMSYVKAEPPQLSHVTAVVSTTATTAPIAAATSSCRYLQAAIITTDDQNNHVDFDAAAALATANVTVAEMVHTLPFHIVTPSDPPPLAFFPKAKQSTAMTKRRAQFSAEPPPLVPIRQS